MKFALITLIFGLSFCITSVANNNDVILTTEDYPPLNYIENNRQKGPAVEIIQAIQHQLHSTTKINFYPFKRALLMTVNNKNTAIFSIVRSKARNPLFRWVGPIATKKYYFYALNKNHLHISTLKDVQNYAIGVQIGGISEEYLKSIKINNLKPVSTPKQNFKKLINGRIDLWYVSGASLTKLTKLMAINELKFDQSYLVNCESFYIGFNKNTPDKIVNQWQYAYQNLYQQGIIKKIYQKYNLITLYPILQFTAN